MIDVLIPLEPELPELAAHDKIDRLEATMRKLPPAEIKTKHYFTEGGVYAREITIPAGTLLTGKIHKTEHLNILSRGTITVYSVTEEPRTLTAPCTFVAAPGSRRVGYCHTEVVWTTIHASEGERDLAALEQRLIEPRGLLEGEEDKAMLEETLQLMIGSPV